MIALRRAASFVGAAGTSYSGAIRLVQWVVIAVVFLFFLWVVRAVWVEVRPAGPRQTRGDRRRAARAEQRSAGPATPDRRDLALEVIQPVEMAGQRFVVDGETTVGRGTDCGIATSYDVYSSTVHARVFRERGRLFVEDLGSTNGTFVNAERVTKPVRLGRGDLLQIGGTVFEVTR